MKRILMLVAIALSLLQFPAARGPLQAQGMSIVNGTPSCTVLVSQPSGGTYDSNSTFTSWSNGGSNSTLTANAGAAPDCTSNALSVIEGSTASTQHFSQRQVSASWTAVPITATMYGKIDSGTRNLALFINSSNFGSSAVAAINLSTCAQAAAASTAGSYSSASATFTSIGRGWCKITLTATVTVDTSIYVLGKLYSGTNNLYSGDGTSGNYIWGVDIR